MNLSSISVIVTAFNESGVIQRCLDGARAFGERIVVDSFSDDGTAAVARGSATTVYRRPYRSPSDQKNWAVARARNDWVLVLDADEVVDDGLRDEIARLESGDRVAFWLRRRNEYLGRTIHGCGWQRDRVLRLYDRRYAAYLPAHVHEALEAKGPTGMLRTPLRHTPYRDVAHHIDKIDSYTTRGARQYVERGGRHALTRMFLHPPFRFLRMFVLQAGFADGYAGLVLCLLSSYSVFLKYAKAWELRRGA
jgi:glycosyltransferase involved in cell wall biosynthesis